MRICLLADSFAARRGYGIARYAQQLHHALGSKVRGELVRLSLAGNGGDVSLRTPSVSRRILASAWTFLSAPDVRHWVGDVDLVHSLETGYPVATRKPLVTTVHDLGPITHPEYFSASRKWLIRAALRQALARAGTMVCPSAYTADALQDFAGRSLGARVCVIPHGVSPCFFEDAEVSVAETLPKRVRERPFVLFTGAISPRKNVGRVLRAFETIASRVPHSLVLTGGFAWSSTEVANAIGGKLRERIVVAGYVDEPQLVWLYRHASAYLYPSLMEGFGLPVLEAMAAGCPVLTSDGTSLSEVAAGCAELVDPSSVESIREGWLRLLEDESRAQQLRDAGRRHAAAFTWDRAAAAVAARYLELAGAPD